LAELALLENIQREDLTIVEEAEAYKNAIESLNLTHLELSQKIGKSRSYVSNTLGILSLPEAILDLINAGNISMGHARALVGVENAQALAEAAVAKQLSVRDIEKLVRRQTTGTTAPRRARNDRDAGASADIAAVQSHLEEFLGLSVRINADADPRSGTVTIRYRTLDQLDLICQRLTGGGI
jgi:ParB family chromosome partitioning protein